MNLEQQKKPNKRRNNKIFGTISIYMFDRIHGIQQAYKKKRLKESLYRSSQRIPRKSVSSRGQQSRALLTGECHKHAPHVPATPAPLASLGGQSRDTSAD